MDERYRHVSCSPSYTGNCSLLMFQENTGDCVPFPIKKVLVVRGMQLGDKRGKHAHRETQEVVHALTGGCDIEVDDGTIKESVHLDTEKAVFLPAQVWRTLHNFEEDTVLLIVADQLYDETDYIRDYDEFLSLVGM